MSETEKSPVIIDPTAEKVDVETWKRKDIFRFFSKISNPFCVVLFRQDITKLYKYVKANGLSFYYSMSYLCANAINAVDAFHYVIRDGELYHIEKRTLSIVDIKEGSEDFIFVHTPLTENMETFSRSCRERREAQTVFVEEEKISDKSIYITCLPHIDTIGFSNPHDLSGPNALNDSIPRIGFGKYQHVNGRVEINISIDINHRFIDGRHVEMFAKKLTELIEALDIPDC